MEGTITRGYSYLTLIAPIFQLFLQPAVSSELYRCPSHLTHNSYLKTYGDHCFLFVNTEKKWTDARDDCYNNGRGHHVVIPDSATQDFVIKSLNELNWNRKGIWIGAYHEGTWKWVNGEPWSWTNWDGGQPGHACLPIPPPNCEGCGQIRRDYGGKWHDYVCDSMWYKYSYICQYDMSPATTTTTTSTTTTSSTTTTTTTSTTTPTITNATSISSTTETKTSGTLKAASSTPSRTTSTPTQEVSQQSTQSFNNLTLTSEFLKSGELGAGAVAGIVSAIVFLGLITGILFLLVTCRRKRKEKEEPSVMFDNRTYTLEQEQNRGNENRNSNPYDEIIQHRPTVAVNPKFTANGGTKNVDYYLTPKTHVDLPDRKSGACSDSKLDDSDDESTIDVDKTKENQYDDIDFTDPKIAKSILQFDENDLSKTPVSYNNNLYDTME